MIDVCLILEGTYPFVAGGVSTWVHQLITSMKDLRFSILSILPYPIPHRQYKYEIPPNVLQIQEIFLHDTIAPEALNSLKSRQDSFEILRYCHEGLFNGRLENFGPVLETLRDKNRLSSEDLFHSFESWETLTWFYERYAKDVSFSDFLWTWRSIYIPIFRILRSPIPKARMYHTVSTGYAGLMASMAKATVNHKMLLTEHGIYTHERLLEISQASWIYSKTVNRLRVQRELPFFKKLWMGLFKLLGQLTYDHADKIVTLYEGNRLQEILDGADPEKISIIPNGIDWESQAKSSRALLSNEKPQIAFIGRVVSIKDVKTFIQAAKIVLEKMPQAEFVILGPMDEEQEYVHECLELTKALGMEKVLNFAGKVDMQEYYSKVDLVVLTSLSEAQPYVILEAHAAGIPIVATDVGACREMLEGRGIEDRKLGPSGILTEVSNPTQTASAIIRLISNAALLKKYGQNGKERVSKFYDKKDLISKYLNLYEKMMV